MHTTTSRPTSGHLLEDGETRVYFDHYTPTDIRKLIEQHSLIVAAENTAIANGQTHTETRDRERHIVGLLLDELDRRAYGTTTERRYQHYPRANGAVIHDTATGQDLAELGDLVTAGATCRRLETATTDHQRALILAGA